MEQKKLNAVYSSRGMKRRYEVWFLRCGMADGSGAWWFRYLVMNLGRGSWGAPTAQPAQVWATWFPRDGERCSFIHGFPIETLGLSERRTLPFYCRIADNGIEDGVCRGNLRLEGHEISWELRWKSDFGVTLSDKGWIRFSRAPHSDAAFSGETTLGGKKSTGEPLGFGYWHRTKREQLQEDESGTFPVANASTARAILKVSDEREKTEHGAVVEFGGRTRD